MTRADGTTRVAAARERAALAKRTLAFGSAAAFVVALLLARAGHPGHSSSSPSVRTTGETQTQENDDFGFGSGTIVPSNSAPQVQSSVS